MESTTKNTGKLKNGTDERYTAVYDSEMLDALKNIAYWERKKIKDVLGCAIATFIEDWKAANKKYVSGGRVKARPEGE